MTNGFTKYHFNYIIVGVLVITLFLYGLLRQPVKAYASYDNGYDFFLRYDGSTENTTSVKMESGTIIKWRINGIPENMRPVFDESDNRFKIWTDSAKAFTLQSANGGLLTNGFRGAYAHLPQFVDIFVANQYNFPAYVTVENGNISGTISDNWNAGYALSFTVLGIPHINTKTMTTQVINDIVSSYNYNEYDKVPKPQLIAVVSDDDANMRFIFSRPTNLNRAEFSNIKLTAEYIDGGIREYTMNNGYVDEIGGDSSSTLDSWIDVDLNYHFNNSSVISVLVRPSVLQGFVNMRVSSVAFDVRYKKGTKNSDWVNTDYTAFNGYTVITEPNNPDISPIIVIGGSNSGFITSSNTQVTGTDFINIIVGWLNSVSVSLNELVQSVLLLLNSCGAFAHGIGDFMSLIMGSSIGRVIEIGIIMAVILRVLNR